MTTEAHKCAALTFKFTVNSFLCLSAFSFDRGLRKHASYDGGMVFQMSSDSSRGAYARCRAQRLSLRTKLIDQVDAISRTGSSIDAPASAESSITATRLRLRSLPVLISAGCSVLFILANSCRFGRSPVSDSV
jgi:hypothetical protein